MSYIQHFGEQSSDYLQFRPHYPDALYAYLASLVAERELAWDCGTGNGQAAVKLADYFKRVIATDSQQAQLDVAIPKSNVTYQCWPAEKTDIAAASVDLVTVAQALHWFRFDAFYQEVRRVAKPGAVMAAWTYSLGKTNPAIHAILIKLYQDILGDEYWPAERRYVDEHYRTIPFPFEKIKTPHFVIEKAMTFSSLLGYLSTWSAVKEYQQRHHKNPIDDVYEDLRAVCGSEQQEFIMHWPVHLLVGKVPFETLATRAPQGERH